MTGRLRAPAYARRVFDAEVATELFRGLVGDRPLPELLRACSDAARESASVEALRAASDLVIRSVAVNGPRVDVVASAGDDEWRVVFGSEDGQLVDWVSVFRRPVPFTGVIGGRAVVANGASSSGKSTMLAALQRDSDLPWVVFDEPFFGNVPIEHLIWREQSQVLHRGFLDAIAALARAGNLVAVAAGGWPAQMFDEAFDGVPTIFVGLVAAPDELARRERTRRDVPGGHALASLDVHEGWTYDLTFDTTAHRAEEIARRVREAVDATAVPDGRVGVGVGSPHAHRDCT